MCNSKLTDYVFGNRPATFDTFPLAGKTSLDNLWILSGTYRDGLHLSPVFAEMIACQMLEKEWDFSIPDNLFKPERAPIQTMTKQEAIEDAVYQYMSGCYEHAIKLPRLGWDKMVEEMIHVKVENFYKRLGTDIATPVEVILMFDSEKQLDHLAEYLEMTKKLSNFKSEQINSGI